MWQLIGSVRFAEARRNLHPELGMADAIRLSGLAAIRLVPASILPSIGDVCAKAPLH